MEALTTYSNNWSDGVIKYSDISKSTQNLDTSKIHRVLLSLEQAKYFRRHLLMMCGIRRRASNAERFGGLKFHALQLAILFRFPRLLELGLFYELDDATLDRVQFSDTAEGTLVTFLPKPTSPRM